MTKKYIKKLALASYTKNELDSKKVKKITGFMIRNNLRQYIKELKLLENKKTITILTPIISKKTQNDVRKQFAKVFVDKKINLDSDPSLILGVKIISNDLIYDLNLKSTLDSLSMHINEQYD
jgi:F0F1-type ATP synthase delta subunit